MEKFAVCESSKQEELLGFDFPNLYVTNSSFTTPVEVVDSGVGVPTSTTTTKRKRRFPTLQEFAAAGEDRIKRKIAPIVKWDTLKIRDIYLVKRVINMDVIIESIKQTGTYAEMADKKGQIINVWLTNIIKEELEKYSLQSENVYIMPLGELRSKETGHIYYDFIIQQY